MNIEVVSTLIANGEEYVVGNNVLITTKKGVISGRLCAILHNKIIIMEAKTPNWIMLEKIESICKTGA